MDERSLRNCRILVVEDEYLIAEELAGLLVNEGAIVLGPVATITAALELIGSDPGIDGALLDLNLRAEIALSVAEALLERDVPFVFTTGCDRSMIPDRFERITRCGKPVQMYKVVRALGRTLA